MKVYISQRHYIRNPKIIKEIQESQKKVFQTDKTPFEAISDSMVSLLAVYGELRKIIRTGNIIQIEHMGEQEVIVAEFDVRHDIEVILVISEDELGNKYIEIPEDKRINKMVKTQKVSETVISDCEVINNFYDEDGDLIDGADVLLNDLFLH